MDRKSHLKVLINGHFDGNASFHFVQYAQVFSTISTMLLKYDLWHLIIVLLLVHINSFRNVLVHPLQILICNFAGFCRIPNQSCCKLDNLYWTEGT